MGGSEQGANWSRDSLVAKRYNIRRIKKNQAYNVEELAEVLGVTQATVRRWLKVGMPVLDEKRPLLVMGFQAQDFLRNRASKASKPLAACEFYCFGCKAPRMPLGLLADYIPSSTTSGRLNALCECCEGQVFRSISLDQKARFSEMLDIATRASE